MGNLTRDPELRYTPKGTAVAVFGLAINRVWKTESGEQKEDVCFVDIEAWARQAEICSQYLTKGSPVFVEGELRYDQWDDKTSGQKRSKLKVHALRVQFIGSKSRGAPGEEGEASPRRKATAAPPPENAGEEPPLGETKDDIPF